MTIILVSGTPGTGKTSIAKKIARHYKYKYVHIGDNDEYIIKEEGIKIIDLDKMNNWLNKKEENLVVDSHLSHYHPKAKACIITRCDPSELKNRLKKRGYSEVKIKTNLEAEAMDLILQEALAIGHKVYEVNTTNRTADSCTKEVIKAIDTKTVNYGKNDFSHHLKKLK